MTDTCSLCGLPTPDPPVTGPDAAGAFCCEGCREVSKTVAAIDGVDAAAVRERARGQEADAAAASTTDETDDEAETSGG